MRILYVEDDARMRALVRRGLIEEGHSVLAVADAEAALDQVMAAPFDVVVLDVMLPDRSGVEVVRDMRARGRTAPVLMLTARDTQTDVVAGLDAGADDYLTKPFAFDVLLARLRALSRRAPLQHGNTLVLGDLSLDPAAHTVRRGAVPYRRQARPGLPIWAGPRSARGLPPPPVARLSSHPPWPRRRCPTCAKSRDAASTQASRART